MAVRTTPAEVAGVMAPGRDYDGKSDLNRYIRIASGRVDWLVTACATYGRTVPANLADIEAWLAAHYYKCSDQQLATSNAGRSSATYRGQTGMGLTATLYGQTACDLDTSGVLKAVNEGRIASAAWTGRTTTEQTDYEDRQ